MLVVPHLRFTLGLDCAAVPTGTEQKMRAFGSWSELALVQPSDCSQERATLVRWRHVAWNHLPPVSWACLMAVRCSYKKEMSRDSHLTFPKHILCQAPPLHKLC